MYKLLYMSFDAQVHALLKKYLQIKLLGYRIYVYSTLVHNAKQCYKVIVIRPYI